MQNHYNLIYREDERELLPFCQDQGVGVIPFSPLARGVLARKPEKVEDTARYQSDELAKSRYEQEDNLTTVERVLEVAQARGIPMAQVALAWMYTKPNIASPIVGTTKSHHLDDALAAMDVNLTEDEVQRLEEPYRPHPVIAHS
jgi:aryl-alcohol dehydrogenase-like predicted oxidoreductase